MMLAAGLAQPWGLLALMSTAALFIALCTIIAYAWRLTHPPRRTMGWAVARGYASDPSELDAARRYEAYEVDLGAHAERTPVWAIEGDDPRGPLLIMTPGWADSRLGQLNRAQHLLAVCSRVVLWDPPGHGEAGVAEAGGKARGRCWLGTREPVMLERLVEHAREQWGGDSKIVLFGSSLGAGVSVVAGGSAGVVGVIAEAPYRHAITPARNVIQGYGYPTFVLLRCSYVVLSGVLGMRPAFTWFRIDGGPFDRVSHAAPLSVPLLVVHGVEDPVSPIVDGRAIANAANAGMLVEVEAAGHNNLWSDERFLPSVRDACTEFLRSVSETP